MRTDKKTIDNMIRQAGKIWGIEDWDLTWEWRDCFRGADIDCTYWTEKRAKLGLDKKMFRENDRKYLFRIVLHEIGHCVVYPIYRSISDWTDHFADKRTRATVEEAINSAENIVIDHMIVQVLKR